MLGLYDSGIGGITILKEIQKLFPEIKIVYFADQKNCPLGEKSIKEIQKITIDGTKKLIDLGSNLIILACNTATVSAIRYIQNVWLPREYPNVKVLGIARPVPEALIESKISFHDKIGIMGTPATISSGFYQQELLEFGFQGLVSISAPELAIFIENQDIKKINKLLNKIFIENDLSKINILFLVCTHYPIIKEIIRQVYFQIYSRNVRILDQSKITAKKLVAYLKKHPEINLKKGQTSFYTSLNKDNFLKKLEIFYN